MSILEGPPKYRRSERGDPALPATQTQNPQRYEREPELYGPRVGDAGNPLASDVSTRLQEGLRKFSMSREPPVLKLLPEVEPTITLLDFSEPENRVLRGDFIWSASFGIVAAAAQFATLWVVNDTPGSLLILEQALISSSVADFVFGAKSNTPPPDNAATFTKLVRADTRIPGTGRLVNRVGVTSEGAAATDASLFAALMGANSPLPYRNPVVITNNFAIYFQASTAATHLVGTFNGRLRLNVDQAELATFAAS